MTVIITEQQVDKFVSPLQAQAAVRAAHLALASGKAVNTPRKRTLAPLMSLHTMSAASTELNLAAAKIYSATKQRVRSLVLLYRLTTGELIAIVEASELGRLRTCATSVVAAQALAEPPLETLAIIGTGYQAEGVIRSYAAVAETLGLKRCLVYSQKPEHVAQFVQRCTRHFPGSLKGTSSAQEAVAEADIIVTVTNSSNPVLEESWILRAKHISALGSNSLARRELDPRIVTKASLVVVDDKSVALEEAGDLIGPMENGKLWWNQVSELGEVLIWGAVTNEGGLPAQGYSLFCSQGLAVQDLYLAHVAYDQASHSTSLQIGSVPLFGE